MFCITNIIVKKPLRSKRHVLVCVVSRVAFNMFVDSGGDVKGSYTVLTVKDDPKAYHSYRKSLSPVGFFRASATAIPVSFLIRGHPIMLLYLAVAGIYMQVSPTF